MFYLELWATHRQKDRLFHPWHLQFSGEKLWIDNITIITVHFLPKQKREFESKHKNWTRLITKIIFSRPLINTVSTTPNIGVTDSPQLIYSNTEESVKSNQISTQLKKKQKMNKDPSWSEAAPSPIFIRSLRAFVLMMRPASVSTQAVKHLFKISVELFGIQSSGSDLFPWPTTACVSSWSLNELSLPLSSLLYQDQ